MNGCAGESLRCAVLAPAALLHIGLNDVSLRRNFVLACAATALSLPRLIYCYVSVAALRCALRFIPLAAFFSVSVSGVSYSFHRKLPADFVRVCLWLQQNTRSVTNARHGGRVVRKPTMTMKVAYIHPWKGRLYGGAAAQ